jgi:hypothetical protein
MQPKSDRKKNKFLILYFGYNGGMVKKAIPCYCPFKLSKGRIIDQHTLARQKIYKNNFMVMCHEIGFGHRLMVHGEFCRFCYESKILYFDH